MRAYLFAVIALFGLVGEVAAQTAGGNSAPAEIGNRANGRDYQPTPQEVAPREKAAGIQPPAAQERADSRDLDRIDRNLLRSEGLSTKSAPNTANGR